MISYTLRKSRLFILVALLALPLTACDLAKNHLKADREAGLEIQDYRDSLASRVDEETEDEKNSSSDRSLIPDLQPYIAQPKTDMKPMPLVSVSVNQTVPLRDVLFELAEQAKYDLELDPRIRGAIIFTARERPFDVVVDRIAEIAGLRYKFEDDILRVEVDTPYNKLYKIDYLSYIRTMETDISSDISVVKGDGADTGSGFKTESKSEINFWGELEANLTQVLGSATGVSLATSRTPRVSATAQNPDIASGAGEAPDAVLNVESLPFEEEPDTSSRPGADDGNGFTFTMNRQAGMINVFANERAHNEVQEYLRAVKRSVTSQVLIEAKILEVTLNDENATGISWSTALSGVLLGDVVANFSTATGVNAARALDVSGINTADAGINVGVTQAASANGVFTGSRGFALGLAGDDVDALVKALSGFGTVKALASPRITALNNQPAALNVSTNRVFFEIDIEISNDGGGGNETQITSEINNVPVGVIVNVQPSIDTENQTVAMAVRPTVTGLVGAGKEDPGVAFAVATSAVPIDPPISSVIPELSVQEIDTVVQMRSGQAIVMGGLLRDKVSGTTEGIPVLSEIPLAGGLFREQQDLVQKTELVIFLKATILDNPSDTIHATDKDLYRKFSSDRRPFNF